MAVNLKEIENVLVKTFPNSKVFVEDMKGDGYHIESQIVSDTFLGVNMVKRHQMVYETLSKNNMLSEIHALSLDLKTLSEDSNTENTYESSKVELNNEVLTLIDKAVKTHDVVLFMKGNKHSPMCGFSSFLSGVLNKLNVEYTDVNVLADQNIRDNIKVYSGWPTIPQLYIKGNFIGGADITRDLYNSGELQKLLGL